MLVMITLMIIIGGLQVFCRYALHNSLSWSEELMRFMYVWIVMIGINLGIRHKSIAAITSLSDMLAKRSAVLGHVLTAACFLLQLLSCVVLLYFGILFVLANKQVSPALRIPMSYIYLSLPIGGGMGVIYTLDGVFEWIKGIRKKDS